MAALQSNFSPFQGQAKADLSYFEKQARVRSSNAANKDRKNLLAAWNWAAQYIPDWPQSCPFQVHKLPEQRFPRYVPPEEDFWKVFSVAESEQDRLMLLCYLHLAARRNEVFQLRKEDVDMHRKKVRLHTRKTKGGSMRSDWLPMTEQLHAAFQKHLPSLPGIWCFPDPQTGLPYVARQQWLARLCTAADVPKFGLHAIRHLSASILVDSRVPLPEVQAVLRHSNLTTTQRYVHRMNTGSCLSSVFDRVQDRKVFA
jgi:integrase